jgi:hypothetical protein
MTFQNICTSPEKIRRTLRHLDCSTLRRGRNLGPLSSSFICQKKGKIPSQFILDDVCENQKAKFRKICDISLV